MYQNVSIFTCKHKDNLINIELWDADNDETIILDITEKELEILSDIIYQIREYGIYPITCEYGPAKECEEIWGERLKDES